MQGAVISHVLERSIYIPAKGPFSLQADQTSLANKGCINLIKKVNPEKEGTSGTESAGIPITQGTMQHGSTCIVDYAYLGLSLCCDLQLC